MAKHKIGTRNEWLAARRKLLKQEKALTHRSDELALKRQELPWVKVVKNYRFATVTGEASLADLFQGRSQLLVYHFMFGPDYSSGCPSCTAIADGFNGFAVHLANHDVMLCAVSRAPLAKLKAYKKRMGWTFPWASSHGSDFNFDYSVGFTKEQQLEDSQPLAGLRACDHARGHVRNRHGHVSTRASRHELVRAGEGRRLPRLFHVRARTRRPVGDVSVAGSCPERSK
jgi:predicted dithiol-disulfide oxidoreductase (DUF899 family)